MKRFMNIIAVTVVMAAGLFAQNTWTLDKAHSAVKFSVSHLVISEVEGRFKSFSGDLQYSKPDYSDAAVDFSIDVNSITTDNEMRDKHLKSEDFFSAEKFPTIVFKGASWKKIDDKNYILEGDMTVKDVTKRVTFTVVANGTIKDPWGNTKTGFKATTTINRFDYNLKWNTITEAGGAVVGKDVTVTLNLEFAQKKSS